jgi:hypothetical protein
MRVEKTRNNKMLIIVGIIIVIVIIGVISNLAGGGDDSDGLIKIPFSASVVKEKNYQDVEQQLRSAGFTNITTEAITDLVTGLLNDDGDVKEVSVDGKTDYYDGEKFAADVKIVVRYHTFPDTAEESQEETEPVDATTPQDDPEAADSEMTDSEVAFSPQDVSDETISSIKTYNDYLTMYQAITEDYLVNYEAAIAGTALSSDAAFQAMRDGYNESFEAQKATYGKLGDAPLIGVKDELVESLISYRDTLKEMTDGIAGSL